MWECGGQHSAYIRDFQLIIDMVIYIDFFQVSQIHILFKSVCAEIVGSGLLVGNLCVIFEA